MIKFFRHIRKSLLMENKTGKYLKYAIGEIVLVVIGILIALQINNWNTLRLQSIKEVNYIKEIRTNLEEDLNAIDSVVAFGSHKSNTIDAMFKLLSEESDPLHYMPSVVQFMPVLTSYSKFTPVRIAFDNMVSSENIDLISNEELLKELSVYYSENYNDGTQERVKEMTRKFGDDIGPLIFNQQMFKSLTNYNSHLKDISSLKIHENERMYSNLFTMKINIRAQKEIMADAKEKIERLVLIIDDLLNQK